MSSKRGERSWSLGGQRWGKYDFTVSGIIATPREIRNSEEYAAAYSAYLRCRIAEMKGDIGGIPDLKPVPPMNREP